MSAQQARERKKSYVQDLEGRSKVNEQKCAQLEQRVKTLERENVMLRSVIKNMQVIFFCRLLSSLMRLSMGIRMSIRFSICSRVVWLPNVKCCIKL